MSARASRTRSRAWHWLAAVRVRAALASVVVIGAAFALSSFGVLSLLRGSLYQSAINSAKAEAFDISSLVAGRAELPAHLVTAREQAAAQVVGPNGRVLTASRNIAGQAAMLEPTPRPGKVLVSTGVVLRLRTSTPVHLDLDERFAVAALGLEGRHLGDAVVVAYSLGAADHAIGVVGLSLGAGLPVLALLVGVLVWALTGWSLRPVERIRLQVAELSATDLSRRVSVPAARDEVGQLARTMNDMLGRLQASNDRQRQLIADVSHELRNPLAALQAQLEVAIEHPVTDSPGMLQGPMAEVNRMNQLVEDLLTLARIDEGMLRLRPVDVDLDDLVLSEAERLRSRGMDISVRGVGAARVRGDEAQLGRVVANLANNAERYARSRVDFALSHDGAYCQLSVSDDGPGVPWFERERIFGRFVRLDTARAHEGTGAGLGLAIVREIVVAHHGEVWVEDAQPGARFVVKLPLTGQPG